jgi:hypothetical protein
MAQNLHRLWVVLLVISGGIVVWFSSIAAGGMWKYFRLNAQVPVKILKWEVQELSSSRFALEAHYRYDVRDVPYEGKTVFESPQFLNRFAAENYMKIHGSKWWQTWYSASRPGYSSLEKKFPKKECSQALLTLGVFVYFFFTRGMLMRIGVKDEIVSSAGDR